MAGPATDTTAEAAKVYMAGLTSLTGSERLERAIAMAEDVKEVTLAGIAHRNPGLSKAEVHREWLRILHGNAIAQSLWSGGRRPAQSGNSMTP